MKPLKELDLLDRFLFSAAMEDDIEFRSQKIRCIQQRINQIKSSEEMGVRYMQAWEEKVYDRQEAREEGKKGEQAMGIKTLIDTLRECNIPDEIIVQKLIDKYGLTKENAESMVSHQK